MSAQPFQTFLLDLLRQGQISQNAFFRDLPAGELDVIGEPDFWSAKDHVAHLTFWRQRLTLRIQAQMNQKPQPKTEHFDKLNPVIFEENRYRTWSDILTESDQAYAELIALAKQLSDEDLVTPGRFEWMGDQPLYISFMGNCYEHSQIHLGYYLLERHDLARATDVYKVWSSRVLDAEVPAQLKGNILYNLACFYSLNGLLEKAATTLESALALAPDLKEWALQDSDLDALRAKQAE